MSSQTALVTGSSRGLGIASAAPWSRKVQEFRVPNLDALLSCKN